MTTALAILKLVALALVCALLAECAWTVHVARPKLLVTIENADRALIATGAAAGNVEKASRAWEASSKEQALQTTKAMQGVAAAAERLSGFVSATDAQLNVNVLPTLTEAIRQQNASMLSRENDLQANLKEALLVEQQGNKTLIDLDAQVANPAIGQSIDNLATATQHASEATAHLAEITKAGEDTALYYQKKLETPESFFKTLAKVVLQLGSEGRILFNK